MLRETYKEGGRAEESHLLIHSQEPETVRTGWMQWPRARTQTQSPKWVAETQVLEPFPVVLEVGHSWEAGAGDGNQNRKREFSPRP